MKRQILAGLLFVAALLVTSCSEDKPYSVYQMAALNAANDRYELHDAQATQTGTRSDEFLYELYKGKQVSYAAESATILIRRPAVDPVIP